MKLLYSLSLVGTILFASCHNNHSDVTLTENSLYVVDTVRMAAAGGDEEAARKKLEEAAALYKKDTAQSVRVFKSSILLHPTAKAYFDLAGALLITHQYDEGIKALSVAEALGYTPLANVLFRRAYAYANMPDSPDATNNADAAVRCMGLAIQMGYAHPQQFLNKTLFPNLAHSRDFDEVYASTLSGGAVRDPGKSLWDAFEGQFPEIRLPLVIDLSWIKSFKDRATIDFQYEKFVPDMREARFSREGGDVYYYVAMIQRSPAFIALLYCQEYEGDESDTLSTPSFTLVTYDPQGKIIDRMPVAGRARAAEPFLVFSIQPNLQFRVQGYINIYKNNPDSVGYDSNPVIRQEVDAPRNFRIAANGKFEQANAPVALR